MANFTMLENQFNEIVSPKITQFLQINTNQDKEFIGNSIQGLVSETLFGMRQNALSDLGKYVNRNIICYYSTWLHNTNPASPNPELIINDNDINGFMNAVSMRDKTKGLDLILQTPGGVTTATESIVKYLRKIFNNDIRVIVPHMAMSAGTMIACAAKEIIMGKESSLGPIDPQYKNVPAEGVLAEFSKAI